MAILVASQRVIAELPFIYPQDARTLAFDPAPNLNVARGTLLGQVTSAVNDVDTVTLTNSPTGGTFTLTVLNNAGAAQTTAPIAYNAAPAAVQAALTALSNVGAGNAVVTGMAGSSYVVTAAGALAGFSEGIVTASGAGLTGAGAQPAAAVAHTTSYATAGEVLPYNAANTDGSQVPVCISLYDFTTDQNGNAVFSTGALYGLTLGTHATVPGFICGYFLEAELPNLDANAVTALRGREFMASSNGVAGKVLLIPGA